MFVKNTVILFSLCALVSAAPASDNEFSLFGSLGVPQPTAGGSAGGMFPQFFQWFNSAGNRVSKGFNGAYDDIKDSVDGTINSAQQMGQKAVESGTKAFQTGIKTFFLLPSLIRHSMDPDQPQNQQRPQYQGRYPPQPQYQIQQQ